MELEYSTRDGMGGEEQGRRHTNGLFCRGKLGSSSAPVMRFHLSGALWAQPGCLWRSIYFLELVQALGGLQAESAMDLN